MRFEVGKAYEHNCGSQFFICGEINTIMYGKCLIGECGWNKLKRRIKRDDDIKLGDGLQPLDHHNEFTPISSDEGATENYFEIPVESFKLDNFDLSEKDKKFCLRQLKLNRILKNKI